MDALAASRRATARLRADVAAVTHFQVRSVEEYQLVFSSVRDGDTRSLIERNIELWNARDREGWMAGMDLHRLELQAPGGLRLAGREAADAIWSTWNEAFPDNRLEIIAIHADDRGGVHEGRFAGTHTGTLRGPGRRDRRDRPDGRRAFQRHLRIRGRQDHQLPPVLRPGGTAHSARHRCRQRGRQYVIGPPAAGWRTARRCASPAGSRGSRDPGGRPPLARNRGSAAHYRQPAPDTGPGQPERFVVMRRMPAVATRPCSRTGPATAPKR